LTPARRLALLAELAAIGCTLTAQAAADNAKPRHVSDERTHTWSSRVEQALYVRASPNTRARRVGRLHRFTASGNPDIVVVLRERESWTRVRYSGVGRRIGWVPSRALATPRLSRSRVEIDRGRRMVLVFRRGREVMRAPVGVGARGSPTPGGRFFIRERMRPTKSIYGALALGLSAHSRHRTDWPGGGQVGIHGTDHPELIPGRISNGCVRLRNRDILRLARWAPVGTPVRVR